MVKAIFPTKKVPPLSWYPCSRASFEESAFLEIVIISPYLMLEATMIFRKCSPHTD